MKSRSHRRAENPRTAARLGGRSGGPSATSGTAEAGRRNACCALFRPTFFCFLLAACRT